MMTTINGVQYREVNREAEVGDFILYRKTQSSYLTEGKTYKVIEIDSANDPQIIDDEGDEYDTCGDDFVVLEKITDSAVVADTGGLIVHEGKQYRKVDRPVREGDEYVIPKKSAMDYTAGKVYSILLISPAGYPHFIDDVGGRYHVYHGDYYVLEPVAPKMTQSALTALETELAATKAKVAEMEAQLAEVTKAAEAVKRAEAEAQRLKVGDYAKVKNDAAAIFFSDDDIVILLADLGGNGELFRCERISDGEVQNKRAEYLVGATDEEVAEAKRKLAFSQFAKGDKVRLVSGGNKHPLNGFTNGEVYEVVASPCVQFHHGTKVQIVRTDGHHGYANPDQLVKLTEGELAEIERKKAEEAKWAAIGRKVGEIKKGDVVRNPRNEGGHPSGTIGIAQHDYSSPDSVLVLANGKTYWHSVELIAPVESIVNLRGGDAA